MSGTGAPPARQAWEAMAAGPRVRLKGSRVGPVRQLHRLRQARTGRRDLGRVPSRRLDGDGAVAAVLAFRPSDSPPKPSLRSRPSTAKPVVPAPKSRPGPRSTAPAQSSADSWRWSASPGIAESGTAGTAPAHGGPLTRYQRGGRTTAVLSVYPVYPHTGLALSTGPARTRLRRRPGAVARAVRRARAGARPLSGATTQRCDNCPAPPRPGIRSWARRADRACRLARRRSRRMARAVLLGIETTPSRWFQT